MTNSTLSLDVTFLIPLALAIIALGYEIIRESRFRAAQMRRQERQAIVDLIHKIAPMASSPDIVDIKRKVINAINSRNIED